MDTGEPSYSGGEDCSDDIRGNIAYSLGFYLVFLLFVFTLCYTSYICNRRMHFQLSPPTTTSDGSDDYHITTLPKGLCDDVISTFPTLLYSEAMMTHNADSETDTHNTNYCSGCAICLMDYKPSDVLRLLPECCHLFHLRCIDTWLKVHPTCPVCRNSFDFSN
ncbi:putative RING-H2 finger protein ATL71 [Lactuca sativa]|uniref:putative RING-H2 finger protein ATL71 n=1 Tax=Lactuca sativa TaxID=4236 RepID=UPI000CD874DF|nr:putative RING-H2 finger protein ATL71 [Lactuca sativa]